MDFVFVDLPPHYESVYLYSRDDGSGDDPESVRQVLWGDFLWLDESVDFDAHSEWTMVVWAPKDPEKRRELRIYTRHVKAGRPLEIIFVDVGQGDGSVLISPERDERERIIVIDAGKGEHMGQFLDARFRSYRKGAQFHAAVITHPDLDHYYGFEDIFSDPKIRFDKLYHSGLAERPKPGKWAKLGGKKKDAGSKQWWLEDLCDSDEKFRDLFAAPVKIGRTKFANTVRKALDNDTIGSFEMLAKHGDVDEQVWMPEFAPDDARGYTIEVLGPLVENNPATGASRMRCFPESPRTKRGDPSFGADYGKTKNGHSVILRLDFGGFRVLFGGDLNRPAEEFLLTRYAGLEAWPDDKEEMVLTARMRLRSEVMKACHHGSSDVTDEFLDAVNPAAFVISSGDEENYVHPRPDLLGRLGKKGRGKAPVLLSTELQRSWREKEKTETIKDLHDAVDDLAGTPSEELRKALKEKITALGGSNVSVDGAIYVKTDGARLITAFKKESQTETDRWFYYEYRIVNDRLILEERGGH